MTHHRHHQHTGGRSSAAGSSAQSERASSERTPAQRYAAFQQTRAFEASAAARFARTLPFDLDEFQRDADRALEEGRNVLVAAPTGAGKTVVADFAMFLAREKNVKAFYTTPIKALSNQKYHDLVAMYGPDDVGLLTGDTSINPQADIVVMTTEVLRNMLYEHSTSLDALRDVVLDEVHYLADRLRGPVWEEVLIHLPSSVQIIALSATVSNVEDFSSWIASIRGDTQLVVSERRPVPLDQHVIVQADVHTEPELLDLYRRDGAGNQSDKLNAELINRLDQLDRRASRHAKETQRSGKRMRNRHSHERVAQPQRYTPRRWAVVDELNYLGLLPGIYFIFSRKGCDQAVQQCLDAGLELTSDEEAMRVRHIVDDMVDDALDDAGNATGGVPASRARGRADDRADDGAQDAPMSRDDLKALGFSRFCFALERGFAPHHAGMIALFRQIVETLFEMGLVKMVFATETLALGINMPARSVIVEKLEKFNGVEHVSLTPGEFTQLTGRAGRRGIDTLGHAIVVDNSELVPAAVASLSSKRVYPLHSSFATTFNMAVNLLNSSDYRTARATLDHSFAQWEANESAWQLESSITALKQAIAGYEEAFACEHGDFKSLITIRMRLSELTKNERRRLKRQIFTTEAMRRQAFEQLDAQIAQLREIDRDQPCRQCPDLAEHMKWGNRWMRERHELLQLQERYEARTGSVARQFDRICDILFALGYVERVDTTTQTQTTWVGSQTRSLSGPFPVGANAAPVASSDTFSELRLTARGQLLRHLYSEQDLVLAQAIIAGDLDVLDPPDMAATLSSLVFQSRRGGGEPRYYPGGPLGPVMQASAGLRERFSRVDDMCREAGLEPLQPLDFGVVDSMHAWASGADLSEVLRESELTGGDFVRTAKRLCDMLQQIAQAAHYLGDAGAQLAQTAHEAVLDVNRGVVAYSGVG
jgi:ATP-dependent RNA helicase HelY